MTLYNLLSVYLSLYPASSARTSLPLSFDRVTVTDVNGCMAGLDTPGYCYAGLHVTFPISANAGFFGLPADAVLTAPYNMNDDSVIGPLTLDVVFRVMAHESLNEVVVDGLLNALPPEQISAGRRYLQTFKLYSVRVRSFIMPTHKRA